MRDAAQMSQRTSRETLARMRYSELYDLAYQLTSELVAVAAFLTSDDKRVIGDRIRSLLGIEEKPARRTGSRAASEVPAQAPAQAPAPAEQPAPRASSKSAASVWRLRQRHALRRLRGPHVQEAVSVALRFRRQPWIGPPALTSDRRSDERSDDDCTHPRLGHENS